jgi:hypothetical protein
MPSHLQELAGAKFTVKKSRGSLRVKRQRLFNRRYRRGPFGEHIFIEVGKRDPLPR